MRRRFLRDKVLDELIEEVQNILANIPQNNQATENLFHYINSLVITYKTAKVTLERIEESIEIARKHDPTGEICSPLVEAASHIQTQIISLHEGLWYKTSSYFDEQGMSYENFENYFKERFQIT